MEEKDIRRDIDPKTRLFSDSAFHDQAVTAFSQMIVEINNPQNKAEPHYTLIIFDVDYFKAINDLAGHDKGNEVIRELGNMLRHYEAERKEYDPDFIGIFGRSSEAGDEFLIALPYHPSRAGYDVADEIRVRVENSDLSDLVNHPLIQKITLSLGVRTQDVGDIVEQVKCFSPGERQKSLESIFLQISRDADTALSYAKFMGKNRVALFGEKLREECGNIDLVHRFYFENLCLKEDVSYLLVDSFLESHPQLKTRLIKHVDIIGNDIPRTNTRFASALADRLYRDVQELDVVPEFLELCKRYVSP